jgi:hypothetical protein
MMNEQRDYPQLPERPPTNILSVRGFAQKESVDPYECPLSDEELRRRASKGGGRPLADILNDLRSRPST